MFKRVSYSTPSVKHLNVRIRYTVPLDILEKNKIRLTSFISFDANTCSALRLFSARCWQSENMRLRRFAGFCRVHSMDNNAVCFPDFLRPYEFATLEITIALTGNNRRYLVSPRGTTALVSITWIIGVRICSARNEEKNNAIPCAVCYGVLYRESAHNFYRRQPSSTIIIGLRAKNEQRPRPRRKRTLWYFRPSYRSI